MEELIGCWVVKRRTKAPRACICNDDKVARVLWRAEVFLYCYGHRWWVDIRYDDYCPPDFNGELCIRIGFAGVFIVLFVGHAT